MNMGWETLAEAKQASLLELIPTQWRLNPSQVPPITSLRDVTDFVCRFLHPHEVEITNSSVNTILENIRSSEWSSLDVTRAFCHRAALAHQLVGIQLTPYDALLLILLSLYRLIAYLKYASQPQRSGHGASTSIYFPTEGPSAHCMGYPSV